MSAEVEPTRSWWSAVTFLRGVIGLLAGTISREPVALDLVVTPTVVYTTPVGANPSPSP